MAQPLKTFASWLSEEGYTEEHIFKRLQPPKVPHILIEPLTEDEIRRLLSAIPQDTLEGVRNYAILLLFLDTGMRLSELVRLHPHLLRHTFAVRYLMNGGDVFTLPFLCGRHDNRRPAGA